MTCEWDRCCGLYNNDNTFTRIQANKRVSRRRLARDINVPQNLRGLLERGVQVDIDREEKMVGVQAETMEAVLGYAGSVRTALWYEIEEDRSKVRCRLGRSSFYHRLTTLVVQCRDGG
jgi:hypothetical protein